MTTSVFRHVVWKEFRVLRELLIALAVIVVVTQAFAWTYIPSSDAQYGFFGIMSAAILLYALGAGAILFAVEREEGTDEFLQALPVNSRELFTVKFVVALASILAIAVALLGVIFVWKWAGLIVEPARDQVTWWERMPGGVVGFSAIALLVFLSGLCCSLLVRRPLVAACVGAGLACVLIYPANLASALARDNHYAITEQEASPFWNYALLATAAVMAVVDFRLGRQWLAGRPLEGRWRRRLAVHGAATLPPFFRRATIHPSTIAAFGRLAWCRTARSWRMMGTFVGVATVICIGIGRMGDPVEVRRNLSRS